MPAQPAAVVRGLRDASMLALEGGRTPSAVGTVLVLESGATLDHERLLELVRARVPYAPRYRQRLRTVPGGLGAPVWVTDAELDLTYHVRRAALPRPGSDVQLEEVVARVLARPFDPDRPLWELYLVEGLEHDRVALVTKVHQALVDGVHAVELAQLLVDGGVPASGPVPAWQAPREPTDVELLTGALLGAVRSPGRLAVALRGGLGEARALARRTGSALTDVATALARTVARPVPASPLNATLGSARRFVMVGVDLDDVRAVRDRHDRPGAEHVTVHDVLLAALTGALRTWLESRGEVVGRSSTLRVLLPVTRDDGALLLCLVDLPIGEPSPVMRLHQIAFQVRRQVDGGRAVPATAVVDVAGLAAPTLHAVGARLAGAVTRRLFNLVVSSVPGSPGRFTVDGHRVLSVFPVVPLVDGQALAVGISTYDGGVYLGLTADRDALPDVDVVGAAVVEALAELGEP